MNKYNEKKRNLIERLNSGPVICAEGFLFEIEKRGYMASGEFVPMVSLDHPEVLENFSIRTPVVLFEINLEKLIKSEIT